MTARRRPRSPDAIAAPPREGKCARHEDDDDETTTRLGSPPSAEKGLRRALRLRWYLSSLSPPRASPAHPPAALAALPHIPGRHAPCVLGVFVNRRPFLIVPPPALPLALKR